jgi:hypothetical protein
MIRKFSVFLPFCLLPCFADDDCMAYKTTPEIKIVAPSWGKEVVRPLQPMDLLHGNVAATYIEEFELEVEPIDTEGGRCIILKSITATIGYSDFLVSIDSRHAPDSCMHSAILNHEDEHIRAHLSVIEYYGDEIGRSVAAAADSIMPAFIESKNINNVLDEFNKKLVGHSDIILLKQKIDAEQEIRNLRIDQNDRGERIIKCEK